MNTKWSRKWESQRESIEASMQQYPGHGYPMWTFKNECIRIAQCRYMVVMANHTIDTFSGLANLDRATDAMFSGTSLIPVAT